MISITTFAGQRVAVFGMARTNLPAAQALMVGGAEVLAWDDGERGRDAARARGIPLVDLNTVDWATIAALVLAPGVPLTHPSPHWTVVAAKAAGVPVIGDIELFFRERARFVAENGQEAEPPVIAITGTNGKSTTTALVGYLFQAAGRDVVVGGNIGAALLDEAPLAAGRVYVLELSSYQIDLTPSLKPNAGVLLNLSPDHLDRHGTMDHYAAVKSRMFRLMSAGDTAVIGVDDSHCRHIQATLIPASADVRAVSVTGPVEHGIWADHRTLIARHAGQDTDRIALEDAPALRGRHNAQNAAVAWALTAPFLRHAEIEAGFQSFPGLAHRMEIVGHAHGHLFVNDSKATNSDAAAHALAAFPSIYWIAGGRAKEGGIEDLTPLLGPVRHVFLVGEAANDFAAQLPAEMPRTLSGTVDAAVVAAAAQAKADNAEPGSAILLSPACASFDQFPDFEARGRAFQAAAEALPGFEAGPPTTPATPDASRPHTPSPAIED